MLGGFLSSKKTVSTKKVRLVARGYQVPYDTLEVSYVPVCRIPTVRLLLSMSLQTNWKLEQIDVPTAFLNGDFDTDVCIRVPKGLQSKESVSKLNRALHGLRNSPRCWNDKFSQVVKYFAFKRSQYDLCLYCGEEVYLVLFVDDAITPRTDEGVDASINKLHKEFKIKDLVNPSSFIGMQINRKESNLFLSQPKMVK